MTPLETLTFQIYARWGLEEMKKPQDEWRDNLDIYTDAYSRARDLLGCRPFDEDSENFDDEFGQALFVALLAELVDEENPVEAALEAIRAYFMPERAPGYVPGGYGTID